jgi:hypothetical protein
MSVEEKERNKEKKDGYECNLFICIAKVLCQLIWMDVPMWYKMAEYL